jgi:hypothetical protein
MTTETDDAEWALQRATDLCASASVDAAVYGKKLLKGFGYPNESFRAAQDARALSMVLDRLKAAEAECVTLRAQLVDVKNENARLVLLLGGTAGAGAAESAPVDLEAL